MTFADYLRLCVEVKSEHERWRFGQTCFNVLYEHRPDLSEQVRGSALDPFHQDERLGDFLVWVAEHWELEHAH